MTVANAHSQSVRPEISDVMKLVVLCDFDGTITTIDTAEYVLARFAQADFRRFDRQFQRGELTLEECLNKQFYLMKASRKEILDELRDRVIFRPNFRELASYCEGNRFPLIVVSAGIDFVIEQFLRLNHCRDLVEVCAPKTEFTSNGIRFTFPRIFDRTSDNFKRDMVKSCKSQHREVIYVGDGFADCAPAQDADVSFAIKGSKLARLCRSHGMPCRNMTDFQEVIEEIRKIKIQGEHDKLTRSRNEKYA